jgi:hypothetical protein
MKAWSVSASQPEQPTLTNLVHCPSKCNTQKKAPMPVIGVLTLELLIEDSHSLKEKRSVVKGLKDRLRSRFNVAVAEIDGHDTWQRAVIAAVTVSRERPNAEQTLQIVEKDAANFLGGALVDASVEWID